MKNQKWSVLVGKPGEGHFMDLLKLPQPQNLLLPYGAQSILRQMSRNEHSIRAIILHTKYKHVTLHSELAPELQLRTLGAIPETHCSGRRSHEPHVAHQWATRSQGNSHLPLLHLGT